MTGIERVKDVEQRLELPAQYQEAVEKHVPVMLAGLEERGVTFDENGSIGVISHAIALVKRLEIGEKVKELDGDVLSQLEEEAIEISRQVLKPVEAAYGVKVDDSELALLTIHVQTAIAKAEKAKRKQQQQQ
ncbi:MAG: PRD domain-containing protein [Angelakisella sp.]|jgi:transcriptional regulatory protein LevR|nr:PRD domain-containing protein [Angelakisella sp.]